MIHARRFQDGSVAASVLLGRNQITGITQSSVSRALCEISFSRREQQVNNNSNSDQSSLVAYLSMRKAPSQHAVHIDGKLVSQPLGRTIPINDGSIISLWGSCTFAYRVQIRNEDIQQHKSDEPPKKRRATASPSSPKKPSATHEIRKRGHQLMVGEQTCSLCMDILIKSTFAYPCSHAFCSECTEQCVDNTCPNCRGKVEGWMPARAYDTIIWATALQGCFDRDDAIAYLERRKENGEQDPTDEEKACILGDAEAKKGSNGYYMPSPPKNAVATATLPPLFPTNPLNGIASNLFGNNLTVNAAAGNGKAGHSADDAIILDSP